MKHFITLTFFTLTFFSNIYAAWLFNHPVEIVQPDGQKLEVLATGDEFHHWLHDRNNFTIVQDPASGFYVYATLTGKELTPTPWVVGKDDPQHKGLEPGINLPLDEVKRLRSTKFQVPGFKGTAGVSNTGTLNNIVIFIRFNDQSEYTTGTTVYENAFNGGGISMKQYFLDMSSNQLTIDTDFYPSPGATVVSYQDAQPRNYYRPYNAATNPIGYQNDNQSTEREMTLLKNATESVKTTIEATGLDFDFDNDGRVDNITYIVQGNTDGWSDLLWPHKWALYYHSVYIGSLRVWSFNFQLSSAFGVSVLCHEMFHTLGAPDLYRYVNDDITPVGPWDLMSWNLSPPQHMSAYMKMKYGQWFSSIPEITTDGNYTLNPLSSHPNAAYKIASPNTGNEYFVVEYRKAEGTWESSLPASGLIISRIAPAYDGNAQGPPDEIYIYRQNGTVTENGQIYQANFSSTSGRNSFSASTNPSCFLSNGAEGGIMISNIAESGGTISFTVTLNANTTYNPPKNLTAQVQDASVTLEWDTPDADTPTLEGFIVYRNNSPIHTITDPSTLTYTDGGLAPGSYSYKVLATYSNPSGESDFSNTVTANIVVLLPDLVFSSTHLSQATIQAGGVVQWQAQISNQGTQAAGSFQSSVYLSDDPMVDPGDLLLSSLSTASLNTGASTAWNSSASIPENTTAGNWYLVFRTDVNQTVLETNENNNSENLSLFVRQSYPDLIVESVWANGTEYSPGELVDGTVMVQNVGLAAALATTTGIYLSHSEELTAESLLVADISTNSIPAGSNAQADFSFNLPSDIPDGEWYLIGYADADESTQEDNEQNNLGYMIIDIRKSLPDLLPQNVQISLNPMVDGNAFEYSFLLSNQGADHSGLISIEVYLSDQPIYQPNDLLLDQKNVPGLTSGTSSNVSATIVLPKGIFSGDYYLLILVDPQGNIEESNKNNNMAFRTLQVQNQPDLSGSIQTGQTDYRPGSEVDYTVTIQNLDLGPTSSYQFHVFISPTPEDPGDDELILSETGPTLEGYGSTDLIRTYTSDQSAPAGTLFMILKLDADFQLNETSEANNEAITSFKIMDISSIGDQYLDMTMHLYPNPATDWLYIETSGSTQNPFNELFIVDIKGVVHSKFSLSNASYPKEINVSFLKPGLYVVILSGDKGRIALPLLKN